ncbi:hypothetical protein [Mesorhizobium sp. IMUNJ 23232]|uniref:hypothetical protein n=1 Tax=Mesorhizobium sp. IMUNJ 23232 TaxID=3376064 RepID=UPI0037C7425E
MTLGRRFSKTLQVQWPDGVKPGRGDDLRCRKTPCPSAISGGVTDTQNLFRHAASRTGLSAKRARHRKFGEDEPAKHRAKKLRRPVRLVRNSVQDALPYHAGAAAGRARAAHVIELGPIARDEKVAERRCQFYNDCQWFHDRTLACLIAGSAGNAQVMV